MSVSQVIFRILLAGLIGFSSAGVAQEPAKDFTFKRIKVEDRPVGKKINIQIEPNTSDLPELPESEDVSPAKPKSTPKDQQDWFWTVVSPKLENSSSDRMREAVAHMPKAPGDSNQFRADPSLLNELSKRYGKEILIASLGKKVSPALILAVIGVESSGRPDAVSSAGAQGLMQLIPETAARFNVSDVSDPQQNITGGAAYLDWLMKEFGGDPLLALAGYNAGENAVKSHGGVPPYAETRTYIPKVVAAWQVARTLCATPPDLASDGCVFTNQAVK